MANQESRHASDGTEGRQSAAAIHGRLREAIIVGELAPGDVKSQVSLSEELGAGRAPVREALRLLQSEGLVEGQPNRRVRIADLSGPDAEELYILRITLEVGAVHFTVPKLGSHDIAELEGFMAQMDHYGRGRDWAGLRAPHRAFHGRLVAHAGPRIENLIGLLFDHAERYRLSRAAAPMEPPVESWSVRQAEHREIVDAASDGDAERTAELLAIHYARSAARVLDSIDPGFAPDRLRGTIQRVMPSAEVGLDIDHPAPLR
jgi:DNA-binding GntR family transcriptional regulator